MPKVITFSRKFPKGHPKAGLPTFFIEKIYKSLSLMQEVPFELQEEIDFSVVNDVHVPSKLHTIRAGKRFKEGDYFSPRIWSGKPYNSKQVEISAPVKVVKVYEFGMRLNCGDKEFFSGDTDLTPTSLINIAANDGLSLSEFKSWFTKPFEGQIICWEDPMY